MNEIIGKNCATLDNLSQYYVQNGYFSPVDVLSNSETRTLRDDYESAEKELGSDEEKLGLLRAYPNRLLPSFDALTRNKKLVETARAILGEDILVWSTPLFIKEAESEKIVSWHQDLTYWKLSEFKETTCWFAISDATKKSGCMKFIPASHKTKIVPHNDTYSKNNLLSRGQEIAVEVEEDKAFYAELHAGQASFHHGLLFHGSGCNQTNDRRIGSAIRYISASMKQETGVKPLVTQVSGEDKFKNFKVAPPPEGRLLTEEFERCREDKELKKKLLF
ncbi:MAG: phytanoyl-CoA dioxygenase family protein [Paracoccaceae bacterium]|nr:phytanoyl-CoA dioxygenase family protein [Paracoccaceae bacterium]